MLHVQCFTSVYYVFANVLLMCACSVPLAGGEKTTVPMEILEGRHRLPFLLAAFRLQSLVYTMFLFHAMEKII